LDQQRLKGGSSWSQEIEQALDAAEVVLTLLSSGAYQSEVCRGEQMRSLRHQKCVIPILVQANSDAPVYLEARQYGDFSDPAFYASRLEDLLADIEARSGSNLAVAYQETRYETVPPLPTNFVARPAELESLRQALLTHCRDRNIELVALRGMPGLGKTVLAQALCYDEAVQAVFPDGIVWVKLGKSPSDSNLIREMRETAKALGAIAHGFETPSESSKRLRGHPQGQASLACLGRRLAG
jgi:TIR domain/NB-ARC domain